MTKTARKLLRKESKTVYWMPPLCSETSADSSETVTPELIRAWLMSLPAESHVNRSALPESGLAKEMNAICGRQQSGAFALYDRDGLCLRTFQGSLLTDTHTEYSESLPRAGIAFDGKFYRQPKLEHRIREIGSGLWRSHYPTPQVRDFRGTSRVNSTSPYYMLNETVAKMYPTPVKRDYKSISRRGKYGVIDYLPDAIMYPTPQTTNGHGAGVHGEGGENLQTAVNGKLNPDWVEWLMGIPIGWSSPEPLEGLTWLDWSVDPADGEAPIEWGTHTRSTGTRSNIYLDGRKMTPTEYVRVYPNNDIGAIPRVTIVRKNRVSRLKGLGNAQVPLCAATAWRILTE
jgi:hypothetical protein